MSVFVGSGWSILNDPAPLLKVPPTWKSPVVPVLLPAVPKSNSDPLAAVIFAYVDEPDTLLCPLYERVAAGGGVASAIKSFSF